LDRAQRSGSRWEVVGADTGLRSVHLHAAGCTADEAAQQAVDRVRAKYGAGTDLSSWTFSVWENGAPSVGERIGYRADGQGRAVRL